MISFLDSEKCTGCGTCLRSCGLDVFRLDTKQSQIAPCMSACPAGNDIRNNHYLIELGLFDEALESLKKTMPFPAITGQICPAPCENRCSRCSSDAAVNINSLEEFLGKRDLEKDVQPVSRKHLYKVAVIGAGPAGMSAAWFLSTSGYHVEVFEAMPEGGGMLRYGLPAHRMPESIVENYINKLKKLGVVFHFEVTVADTGTVSIDTLKKEGFRAVVVATGASVSRRLMIEGENQSGVIDALTYLRDTRIHDTSLKEKNVIIIGGGDVAMDVATTASKQGAKSVQIFCLEKPDEMPAQKRELAQAQQLGAGINTQWGATSIQKNSDGKLEITFQHCISLKNEKGQFAPKLDPRQTMKVTADRIVTAIGQTIDRSAQKALFQDGKLMADPATGITQLAHCFVAGDFATGPGIAAAAIAGARNTAASVMRYLEGRDQNINRKTVPDVYERPETDIPHASPRNERKENEIFDVGTALSEANRCLTCGAKAMAFYTDECMTCWSCEVNCPSNAIKVHPFKELLPNTLEMPIGGVKL